ncbi:LCP family protein [Murimonas intestini]|uniref:LytR family transcriptional attenuator n=1 Tax=Murimonas intestini TaxID=1337051 RepID=A0AB73T4P0_9FIRM|nr:LCP family protein [Murimonas intestini]MCR1840597.1 LCP family protein [Murimonas intestini]MCR1865350.1 LCP family protein [Murimonas intestini]MCR1882939.1 LCP family protein [Murimonas intestini]
MREERESKRSRKDQDYRNDDPFMNSQPQQNQRKSRSQGQGAQGSQQYGNGQAYGNYGGPQPRRTAQGNQNYGQPYGGNMQGQRADYSQGRNKKKSKRKKKRIWLFVLEILVLLIAAAFLFLWVKYNKIQKAEFNPTDVVVNQDIDQGVVQQMKGYTTYAFFGVDSRTGDLKSGTNSDTIMLCSINNDTKEIKLASVYRDSYLDNTNGRFQKVTEVYGAGGAQQSLNVLNKNLDLNITQFITVDFNAIVEAVDIFGGIDLELTEGEVKWLNGYLVEGRDVLGKECDDVPGPGMQHLNGMQALAYCRIRYIGLDYERTERQRKVLEQLMSKAKSADLLTLNSALDKLLPMVYTNLDVSDMMDMLKDITSFNMGETTGFPLQKTTQNNEAGDVVVPINLAENVKELHAFLYGQEAYTPSATVQSISSQIVSNTGVDTGVESQ